MPTGLLILMLAFGYEPPFPQPKPAKVLSYPTLYARVLSGERLIAAVGVDAGPGEVRAEIPGEGPGRFELWLESRQVCRGDYCEIIRTPMMRRIVPQVMQSK